MNSYLLFDPTLPEVSTLLEGLDQNCLPIPIDRQSIFKQFNKILLQSDTFEINILAHGKPGGIYVDGEFIGESQWVKGISQLSSSATQNLDINSRTINFWSCETGAGDSGSNFAEIISITTAATVNMSSDKVGHASQGANWDLDVNSMPAVPFSKIALDKWENSLGHASDGLFVMNKTLASTENSLYDSSIGTAQNFGWVWTNPSDAQSSSAGVSSSQVTYSGRDDTAFKVTFEEFPGAVFYTTSRTFFSDTGSGMDFLEGAAAGDQLVLPDETPLSSNLSINYGYQTSGEYVIFGSISDVQGSPNLGGAGRNLGGGTNEASGKAYIVDSIDNIMNAGSIPQDIYLVATGSLDELKAINYTVGNAVKIDAVGIEVMDVTNTSGIDTTGLPNPNFGSCE